MQKCILPVTYPIITHSPPVANLLSIIGNTSQAEEWIMNHYINIYIDQNIQKENFFNRYNFFNDCPYVFEDHIGKEVVNRCFGNIIDFFIQLLEQRYYIYLMINSKHIQAYGVEDDDDHNIMIYGYDMNCKTFHIADFFQGNRYQYETCSFHEMSNAFYEDEVIKNGRYYDTISMLKRKNTSYHFDLAILKEYIKDHLNSVNLFIKHMKRVSEEEAFYYEDNPSEYACLDQGHLRRHFFFGLKFYDELIRMYTIDQYWNMRPISLLCDHKKLMLKRLEFIHIRKQLDNFDALYKKCNLLKKNTTILQNIFIKAQLRKNYEMDVDIVVEKLNRLRCDEEEFTLLLLQSLL